MAGASLAFASGLRALLLPLRAPSAPSGLRLLRLRRGPPRAPRPLAALAAPSAPSATAARAASRPRAGRGLAAAAAEPGPGGPEGQRPLTPEEQGAAADRAFGGKWVVELGTAEDFQVALLSSLRRPLLLDAYADWCGPCKTLTPRLEAAAAARRGAFRLAKLNVDAPELQAVVQQLQVQSLPTVLAVAGGAVQDVQVGVPPDDQLEALLDALVAHGPGPEEDAAAGEEEEPPAAVLARAGELLEALAGRAPPLPEGDPDVQACAALLAGLLGREGAAPADRARAHAGLARLAVFEGNLETAAGLVAAGQEAAQGGGEEVPELEALAAQIALAREAGGRGLGELEALLEASPDDPELLHEAAAAKFAAGRPGEAVDLCMRIVKKHREWNEEAGRKLALKFFDALGPEHPVAVKGRKRLTNLWFC